jgi:hypothetical protein
MTAGSLGDSRKRKYEFRTRSVEDSGQDQTVEDSGQDQTVKDFRTKKSARKHEDWRAWKINGSSYNLYDQIHQIATYEQGSIRLPDEHIFPSNINKFWKLILESSG